MGDRLVRSRPQLNVEKNVALAPHSTFQIGGRAELFCSVGSPEAFIAAVRWALEREVPYRVFASGSNVVFPDGTLRCLLVQFLGGRIAAVGKNRLLADAGVSLASVIGRATTLGLRGIETLSGIPGTVGGAVVGNVGAYGHSISEVIEGVEIYDGECRRWLTKQACRFAYRESIFKRTSHLILRVRLKFTKRDASRNLRNISRSIITLRERKYKPGLRCPGSFFKNVLVKNISKRSLRLVPPERIIEGKIPAGYLLEQVGAKGMRVGGVEIACSHGNLFVNRGGAAAADVEKLARALKGRVWKKFGIQLEEEIRYF